MNNAQPNPEPDPSNPFGKIAAHIQGGKSNRIETKAYVIHPNPRISAAKLAEYIIADPSRQKTISKNSKKTPKSISLYYSRVRDAVPHALCATGLDADILLKRSAECEAAPFSSDWGKTDNGLCSEALKSLALMVSKIECSGGVLITPPGGRWMPILIAGVQVSIQPEMVFSQTVKGVTKIGGVILNTTQEEGRSLSHGKDNGKDNQKAGHYLAFLVYHLLSKQLTPMGNPLHTRCQAVDVHRGTVHTAPKEFKTLLKHIEAACEMIALRWPTIEI